MAHSSSHSERSIHEMLKDTPPMNESNSAIQSGIEGRVKHPNSLHVRTNSGKNFFIPINILTGLIIFEFNSSNDTNTAQSII